METGEEKREREREREREKREMPIFGAGRTREMSNFGAGFRDARRESEVADCNREKKRDKERQGETTREK